MIRRLILALLPACDRWYLQRADLQWLILAAVSQRSKSDLSKLILARAISSHFDHSFDRMGALSTRPD